MTSTPELLDGCDDPASLLGYARGRQSDATQSDRDVMLAAAKFASMHTEDSLVGPIETWHESCLPLGGSGCPGVAEFAILEFAAALGMSSESGRRYLARAVEGLYRLPDCWKRLQAGTLPAWRLGMIADATMCLSRAAAEFVDTHVAPVAHKVGPAQLMRLVEEAKARFDPEQAEADRKAAAEQRHLDIDLAQVGVEGIVRIDGSLDLADALDLESAVADLAHRLLLAGCTECLDVRRAMALGLLARGQQVLDLADQAYDEVEGADQPRPNRQVVLHVHLAEAALHGTGGLGRCEQTRGPITAEQVRLWCGDAQVVVKPVLDLDQHQHVECYEIPDRLKQQAALRDITCIHPYCTRRAVRCDCDHRANHPGGPTCTCNLAPMCRPHHRAKTTGGWSYVTVQPGVYLWRSPLGYQYLRDATGTIDVTPDDDRRRYAREMVAHFGDHPPDT